MSRRDIDLWPLDLELPPYSTSGVRRLNSVQNLSEIEWSTDKRILARFRVQL